MDKKESKLNSEYRTKDIYIASVLLAKGIELKGLEPAEGNKDFKLFVFYKPVECEILVAAFWNNDLTLKARSLFDSLFALRNRLKAEVT